MKYIMITILLIMIFTGNLSNAQTEKQIGHVNVMEVYNTLPESDSIQDLLEKESNELQLAIEQMYAEYNQLVVNFEENSSTYSELVEKEKKQAISDMERRIRQFEQDASIQLQSRYNELVSPIYERIQEAIEKVAKQQGLIYVLDTSKGTVVYAMESHDITTFVIKELGI